MTYATKTKLCFAGAGGLALLALYCFAGAIMNGSFAVAGGADVGRFHRGAAILFWLSVCAAAVGLGCLILGVARAYRSPKQTGSNAAHPSSC